jgi:hypothetical protein
MIVLERKNCKFANFLKGIKQQNRFLEEQRIGVTRINSFFWIAATTGSQAAQTVYEITFMEENAKVHDFINTITISSGLIAKNGDLGLMESIEDTYVWVHMVEACPKMYHGVPWLY